MLASPTTLMPLFRRTSRAPEPAAEFTVGLRDNRVQVGAPQPGIAQLDELRDYVGSVTGHAGQTQEGRDPVAVLNAKMDFAELVNDAASNVSLAFEELCQRGVVSSEAVPHEPELPPVPQHSTTYDYIQATHGVARRRRRGAQGAQLRAAAAGTARRGPDAQRPPLAPFSALGQGYASICSGQGRGMSSRAKI